MRGPAGVTAIVLAETVAGGVAVLFLTPLWNEVKRGFFAVAGGVLTALAAAAWLSARAGVVAGDDAGAWGVRLAAATAGVLALHVLLALRRFARSSRMVGFAAVPLSAAMLVSMARTGDAPPLVATLQVSAGAAFLGTVLMGLLLGHWYLTDRGLSRAPILRATALMGVGVVLAAAAVVAGGFEPTAPSAAFNPLLTSAGLASWIALGMVATTGLVAVMTRLTLRGERASAVQAATGFFYLAVITGLTAEFAAKVRFLP